jgi:hypothetical protein
MSATRPRPADRLHDYERRSVACRAFSCKVFVENADGTQAEDLSPQEKASRGPLRRRAAAMNEAVPWKGGER